MVKLNAEIKDSTVLISFDSFEHLLNCLDNQKYINCVNADASTGDYKKTQRENQAAIDNFSEQCRNLIYNQEV